MGSSSTGVRSESKSPKQSTSSPPGQDRTVDPRLNDPTVKPEGDTNVDGTKPLAPPPRPGQQQETDTPDYFSGQHGGSLSLEPNPFEQSFGGAPPETPGGTKLPSVAALTSPSSLLPGSGVTPFNWGGGSLRTGPLSPAMLSAPANDYFTDAHHFKGGFPTPNESSLRTGLTPGGSGSMFPAPSPNSQALFAQLASGGATPGTIDFHRTALSAAKREQQAQQAQQAQAATSQPSELTNGVAPKQDAKPASGPFDPHDNDAANGLFMLAQGRSTTQPNLAFNPEVSGQAPGPVSQSMSTSPQMASVNGVSVGSGSARGVSEAASMSEESEPARPNTRAKGKRNAATAGNRRKAEDAPAKAPANKKAKTSAAAAAVAAAMNGLDGLDDHSDDDDLGKDKDDSSKSKMTDEEKRKNFLERNRVAALKCRQRKKQWLANLQSKVELFSTENDALTSQISQLREEVVNLKTLLLAHKDCPVTQQQGLHGAFLQVVEPYNAQMNPYGMAAPIPNQQVLAGQSVQRRFS